MTPELELWEGGDPVLTAIDDTVLDALVASDLVEVHYRAGERAAISARRKVGVSRIGTTVVRINPKLPIQRIMFLLGFARERGWRSGAVPFAVADELLPAIADAYLRQVEPALETGVLQGYREIEDALTVVRGRIREQDQLRQQFGIPLPLLVRYDDFSTDIVENRLLRTAAVRLVRLPGLDGPTRSRLRHIATTLSGADLLPARTGVPSWQPTRLNERFHLALWLAELVVRHTMIDLPRGNVHADGFIVDMAKVFEDFVTVALGGALAAVAGRCVGQRQEYLDEGQMVSMNPDLTWIVDDAPAAVIDAKYKAEKPAGFPNADVYQMLAYCTALRLPVGHLVYAKGNEAARSAVVRHAGIEIRCHTLDLDASPSNLRTQVSELALSIASVRPATASFIAREESVHKARVDAGRA